MKEKRGNGEIGEAELKESTRANIFHHNLIERAGGRKENQYRNSLRALG